ncbi:restriction endonuclease subunit S [Brevundimonas bacteroides]|uniref:restriction endonuclease subunit S n=1 Tax=Brevundimonas bacteroides TaxID=74311 RepID=UPI0012ED5CC2|nr:restriction endonuclease subunit S [Brevundimonas bacteroides]
MSAKVIKDGRILKPIVQRIAPEKFQTWMRRGFPEIGDVILTTEGPLGQVAQIDDEGYALGQRLVLLRGQRGVLDNRFLRYWLMSFEGQQRLQARATGTTVAGISQATLRRLPISKPDFPEQVAIGDVLGSLDDKIEANRRMNETLEGTARALFKSWFIDFDPVRAKAEGRPTGLATEIDLLMPSSMDESETHPSGWSTSGFDLLATPGSEAVSADVLGDDTPYIALEHMPRRSIVLAEWEGAGGLGSNKSRFRENDILFGKLRPYFHKVGLALVDGVCSTDIVVLRPKASHFRAMTLFAASSDAFVSFVDVASTGTKMPRTNWARMKQFQVVDPGPAIAGTFEDVVSPMLARIKLNTQQSRTLADLRDLLLPKLMSGAIRVRDAEKMLEQVA